MHTHYRFQAKSIDGFHQLVRQLLEGTAFKAGQHKQNNDPQIGVGHKRVVGGIGGRSQLPFQPFNFQQQLFLFNIQHQVTGRLIRSKDLNLCVLLITIAPALGIHRQPELGILLFKGGVIFFQCGNFQVPFFHPIFKMFNL